MSKRPDLTFCGAAETVTGSRYLVRAGDQTILVDCGLFQGFKRLRERNWSPPPFSPKDVNAVVLTHAHIDHSGYLPRLCQDGFAGPIYCTKGTGDLLQILLRDSAHLMEEDAKRARRGGYSRHASPEPLYTVDDANQALKRLSCHPFDAAVPVAKGIEARFSRAGHIIGSSAVRLAWDGGSLVFSGDVGRPHDPIMKPPAPLPSADTLVIESTYGDRRHPSEEVSDVLAEVITSTAERDGTVIVPAFAVGRAQHLLHLIADLKQQGRIPDLPVSLDSPMAINASRLFCDNTVDHVLSDEACHAMCNVADYASTPEASKALDRSDVPRVIISASGMLTGGRVLHHLRRFLPFERNTLLMVGYQAGGTRGRSLVDGTDELKIHGQYVPVKARVVQVGGLSAHADYSEMIDWLARSDIRPKKVFVTHGEASAADAFRRRLRDRFGWDVVVPTDGSTWELP